jgi:hypothetical protein
MIDRIMNDWAVAVVIIISMLYLVNREKQMKKNTSDGKFSVDRKLRSNEFNNSKQRFMVSSFDGLSTKDLSTVQRRATSAVKNSSGLNRTSGISENRKKELSKKYGFSRNDMETYEKICVHIKGLSEKEKAHFIGIVLEKTTS